MGISLLHWVLQHRSFDPRGTIQKLLRVVYEILDLNINSELFYTFYPAMSDLFHKYVFDFDTFHQIKTSRMVYRKYFR